MMVKNAVKLLREMVAIPSPSFKEEEVSAHVSAFLSGCGIEHKKVRNNIVALSKDFSPARQTLMLCAHLDTVQPCSGYDFDPYSPDLQEAYDIICRQSGKPCKLAEELIPGLGANDDGASAVSLIAVFRHFYDASLPFNLMLVLSTEEERSGKNGMRFLWQEMASGRLPKPDFAIVGEPTGMKAARAERGLLVLDGCAKGESGHAARGEGINALYIALDDIARLRSYKFDRISPLMGEVRLNVTQISAGTAHNVIPDTCNFVVDIRPTEQYGNEEILQLLQAECRSVLKARNLSNRCSATSADSPLLKCAEQIGIETFVSPTTSDWMRLGCDAIKMGPGDSSRSHRKNEYVTVSEIEEAVALYIEFIEHINTSFRGA